jgi:hypothetical protein
MTQFVEVPGIGPVGFPDGMSQEDMAAALKMLPASAPAYKTTPAMVPPAGSTPYSGLKGSAFGGAVRGARDVIDEGALLAARALEGLAPSDTAIGDWAKGQRQNVEAINREAEREYSQEWRGGKQRPDQADVGRVLGGLAVPATVGTRLAIRAGAAPFRAGAIGGATAGAVEPVGPAASPSDYFAKKIEKTGAATAVGGLGGKLLSGLGQILLGTPKVVTPAAEAATGDVAGTAAASLEAQLTPTATVRGGGSTLGKVGPDTPAGLTEGQAAALAQGKQLGMRVTPGQETGSRSLQQMEARMESNPFFSGPFNDIKIGNQRVLNRAAANAIGETADELSSPVLARAKIRIGKVYDQAASPTVYPIDGDTLMNGVALVSEASKNITLSPVLNQRLVKQAIALGAKGAASGQELQVLSSNLNKLAKNVSKNDGEMAKALMSIKEHVDDALASTMGPEQRAAFQEARQQYRNLVTLKAPGVVNPSSGNVSGQNLAGALTRRDEAGFFYGGNTSSPMHQAARFAQAFKPLVGDSGTATRSMELTPLNMMLSMPTRLAAQSYATGTAGAAARAAAGEGLVGSKMTPAARAAIQKALPVTGGIGANYLLD